MKLNKKAEEMEIGTLAIYSVVFLLVILFMGGALYFSMSKYHEAYLRTAADLDDTIFAHRAIDTCLAYQDSVTKRYYPGIIDISKYNQQNLDECYSKTDIYSFNFKLSDSAKNTEYDRIYVGFGASLHVKTYDVLIRYQDNAFSKGQLEFGMSK